MYDWLKDYIKIKNEIIYLEFQLEQSRIELKRWVEGDLSNVKLEAESRASKLEEIIEKQAFNLEEKRKQRDELISLVEKFEGLENQILRMKWFDGKSLEQIAQELSYSYGYIKRKHADIMRLIKFAETFK